MFARRAFDNFQSLRSLKLIHILGCDGVASMRTVVVGATIAAGFFMTSCSGDDSDSDDSGLSFSGSKVVVVEGSDTLTVNSDEVSGTGAFAFVDSLGSTDGGSHFDVTFQLDDGGKVEIIAYGDESLNSGVNYAVSRSGNALSMTYSSSSVSHDATSKLPTGDASMDPTGTVRIWIDTHNDESPLHTLFWSPTGLSKDSVGEEGAFFNSEELLTAAERESGSYSFPSSAGTGRFWGIRLQNARVQSATTGEPLFEEGEE